MLRVGLTALVILVAAGAVAWKYVDYLTNPWTRDGQVRAQVIQVAARVTGPVVDLPIDDNQAVAQGDLLFRIDQRTFKAQLNEAQANLDLTRNQISSLTEQVAAKEAALDQVEQQIAQAQAGVDSAKAAEFQVRRNLDRVRTLVERGDVAQTRLDEQRAAERQAQADIRGAQAVVIQAQAALSQAKADLAQSKAELGAVGDDNARLRSAQAALEEARLNVEFTEVRATVDGFVTNLKLRLGSQAVANQPVLALVDRSSFWVEGYFRESMIDRVDIGDPAVVTLMSYPSVPLSGRVHSLGWGIANQDGTTGQDLLPQVNPTFQWIRLAQRVPVLIELDPLPDEVKLRVGTTASVLVMTDGASSRFALPLPAFLQ